MNIQQMMKQAQQMQERLQKQMNELRVEGNAGEFPFWANCHHEGLLGEPPGPRKSLRSLSGLLYDIKDVAEVHDVGLAQLVGRGMGGVPSRG